VRCNNLRQYSNFASGGQTLRAPIEGALKQKSPGMFLHAGGVLVRGSKLHRTLYAFGGGSLSGGVVFWRPLS
jgi:hypothetical protein